MTKISRSKSDESSHCRPSTEESLQETLRDLRRRQAEISALLEGSRAVLEHREFQDAARAIFDSCKKLIGASSGYVALLSADGKENDVLFLDSGGLECTVDPELPMPIRGLREEAYRGGEAVYDNDFSHSRWVGLLPEGHVGLQNVLFAPLLIEEKAMGVLGIANKPGGFNDNDARMASAFGELAAIALRNSRILESLENSEERFRSLAQSINDGIVASDNSGKIVFWNEAAERMFGYSAAEMIGRPLTSIMPRKAQPAHQAGMLRVVSTGRSRLIGKTVEVVGLRKNGSEFPVDLSLGSWKTKEGVFFTGILRDVSQRKKAEKALQKAKDELEIKVQERTWELRGKEESLAEAQRIAHLGNWDWTIPTNELLWSDEVYRIFGLQPREFAATYDDFLKRVHPDDRGPVEAAVRQALAKPGTDYGIDHRIIRPDRSERVVHERGEVTFDASGKPVRMIGTIRDITDQRKLEREILSISNDEQRRIAQELHDGLGQELTGLGYLARSLHRKLLGKGLPEADVAVELADGIPQALGKVRMIVKGILPLEVGTEDLAPALQVLMANTEERTGISCRFENTKPVYPGDDNTAIQLYRIVQEAVTNAVKHGRPEHIVAVLSTDRNRIVLQVRDDGVGIRPEGREVSGLGLRIMRYRAHVIGATLDVKPGDGGGTLVTCTLGREPPQ